MDGDRADGRRRHSRNLHEPGDGLANEAAAALSAVSRDAAGRDGSAASSRQGDLAKRPLQDDLRRRPGRVPSRAVEPDFERVGAHTRSIAAGPPPRWTLSRSACHPALRPSRRSSTFHPRGTIDVTAGASPIVLSAPGPRTRSVAVAVAGFITISGARRSAHRGFISGRDRALLSARRLPCRESHRSRTTRWSRRSRRSSRRATKRSAARNGFSTSATLAELYKDFVKFYYSRIMTDGNGLSVKLTELVRHTVAVHNACTL